MHTIKQALLTPDLPGRLRLETNGVPIYVQIREQVLQAIGAGLLGPGDQMPTMRQVAVALKIDLNTVRHAYDELEQAGAITLIHGRGSFVAEQPPQLKAPPAELKLAAKQTERIARKAIAAATAAGIDPAVLANHIIALSLMKEASS